MKTILDVKSASVMAFLLLLVFTLPAVSQDFGADVPDMQNLNVFDQSVEKEMAVAKDILGLPWAWQYTRSLDDHRLTPKKVGDYTLLLGQGNVADLKVDCNRAHGRYTLEGKRLQFEIGIMTRAMCSDPEMDNSFLRAINLVEFYTIENGLLVLKLEDKETLMVFEPFTEAAGDTAE